MARHHYVPAGVVGLFSLDSGYPRRDRKVACLRRSDGKVWTPRADKVLIENDLYSVTQTTGPDGTLYGPEPEFLEKAWTTYERGLPAAIERIERRERIDATTWLGTLVPFVTSLFVRGREFNERFTSRNPAFYQNLSEEDLQHNITQARVMEMQRLLAPVCAADWKIIHAPAGSTFITNDLMASPGYMTRIGEDWRTFGWMIPLSRSTGLVLMPRTRRKVMALQRGPFGSEWTALIEHYDATPQQVHSHNRVIAASCREIIIAADRATAQKYQRESRNTTRWGPAELEIDLMDGWGQVPSRNRREHEFDWHRLVSVAAQRVRSRATVELDRFDWDAIDRAGWKGPILMGANTGIRQSGLSITSGLACVVLDLRILEGSHPTGPAENWHVPPAYGPGASQKGLARTINLEQIAAPVEWLEWSLADSALRGSNRFDGWQHPHSTVCVDTLDGPKSLEAS